MPIRRATAAPIAAALFACNQAGSDVATTREDEPDAASSMMSGSTPVSELDEEQFDVLESQTLAALRTPEVSEGLCRVVAVGASSQATGAQEQCERALAACNEGAGLPFDAGALGNVSVSIPADAEQLVGCDVTVAELDACIAQLVTVIAQTSSELTCSSDAGAPALGPESLLGAQACLIVGLRCPQLLQLLTTATG